MWLCASGCAPSLLQIQLPEQPLESWIGAQRMPIWIRLQSTQPEVPFCVRSFEQGESLLLLAETHVNAGQRVRRNGLRRRVVLQLPQQRGRRCPVARREENPRARGNLVG